jgi:excisionase family DNA binding protein
MNYITIPQLAKMLNFSRVTVFNWVKSGKIKATKIGGTWIIDDPEVLRILEGKLTKKQERDIKKAITSATQEYGELFKRLSKE